jgi:type VI secretion system secreted protein VgrG
LTNGAFLVHAASHATEGPQHVPLTLVPKTPTGSASLEHLYHDNEPVQGATFEIHYDDGQVYSGVLDSAGHADLSGAPVGTGRMKFGPDARPWECKAHDANPTCKATWTDSDMAASASKNG